MQRVDGWVRKASIIGGVLGALAISGVAAAAPTFAMGSGAADVLCDGEKDHKKDESVLNTPSCDGEKDHKKDES